MQAKLKTQPYETFDPVFEGSFEAPLDMEYDLPDYCPDIRKVLKCQASPELSGYELSDDTLSCEGVCEFRVLYLDAQDNSLRCCEFTREFTASVKTKGGGERAVAWVQAGVQHLTCRAVSARRLDVHLAVGLRALAVIQRQEQLTCGVEDAAIEKMVSTHQATQAVNALGHRFTLEEDLPLKNGKPPLESILRKSLTCRVLDARLGEDRLTVSGALEVSFLYLPAVEGVEPQRMTASVDFTQTVECPGAQEGCLCDLKLTVGESTLQPREDDLGENTEVKLFARVFLTAFLYRSAPVEVVDDVYSVQAPLELRYGQAALIQAEGARTEVLRRKITLSAPEEFDKILDLWCEQDGVQSSCEKGKLTHRVKTTVCLLAQGADGRILYAEKAVDFTAAAELEDGQTRRADSTVSVQIWEYRIADKSTVEVELEAPVTAFLSGRSTVSYLTSAGWEEGAQTASAPRLTVYYGQPGERLWDIAKSHRAVLADLRTQNDLTDDTLPEARPILITTR